MNLADLAGQHPHAEAEGPLVQCGMQRGTADPQAAGAAEGRFGPDGAVQVPDAAQFAAGDLDTQCSQRGDTAGHDTFSAGLVHGRCPWFDHDGLQTGERGVDGGGKTGRTSAAHEYVDHAGDGVAEGGAVAVASARFSQRMRTVSSTASSTVNTAAVTQAVCTRGSATPSATTAT